MKETAPQILPRKKQNTGITAHEDGSDRVQGEGIELGRLSSTPQCSRPSQQPPSSAMNTLDALQRKGPPGLILPKSRALDT